MRPIREMTVVELVEQLSKVSDALKKGGQELHFADLNERLIINVFRMTPHLASLSFSKKDSSAPDSTDVKAAAEYAAMAVQGLLMAASNFRFAEEFLSNIEQKLKAGEEIIKRMEQAPSEANISPRQVVVIDLAQVIAQAQAQANVHQQPAPPIFGSTKEPQKH